MVERTFDRVPQFDERNRQYPIGAVVGARPLRSYTWNGAPHLDQGTEGACVGFGWAHELAARPVKQGRVTAATAKSIYREAQKIDPWPGEDYDGTSVLAGAKIVQGRKAIGEYRWAFGMQDTLLAVGYAGPVVLGAWWFAGMAEPDAAGFISPVGSILGGHCVMVKAVSIPLRRVTIHNSWGPRWGVGGDAYMTFEHFEQLLAHDAEVCVPMKRKATTNV